MCNFDRSYLRESGCLIYGASHSIGTEEYNFDSWKSGGRSADGWKRFRKGQHLTNFMSTKPLNDVRGLRFIKYAQVKHIQVTLYYTLSLACASD